MDKIVKFFPRSGDKKWDSHSHGYHVAVPLLHVPPQEDHLQRWLGWLPLDRQAAAQAPLVLSAYNSESSEDCLKKKLRQAYYALQTLVTSQPHSPDPDHEKNGLPAASYHHLLGLLLSRPINMWAVMRLIDEEEFHDFVEFHLSLSFTPLNALYPNGFPAHSTDALPPSFRAWAIWGSVAQFGTNYLPTDMPPPWRTPLQSDEPCIEAGTYPGCLPLVSARHKHLPRNTLCQALPLDAEDCPPEDQHVTPAIVARNVQPFLGLLPTPRHGTARPQNLSLGLAARTGHSSMSWRMPTGWPSPSCKAGRQQLNRWPWSKALVCLLPLGCKLFSVCAYPTLIWPWFCQPWTKELSTVVFANLG